MVRHTGIRHWPIIAHCPKYRIEGIDCMLQTGEQGKSGNTIKKITALGESLSKY